MAKWKRFPHYWSVEWEIHRSTVDFLCKCPAISAFLCCYPEQAVEQAIELPMVRDALPLMWYHCNECTWRRWHNKTVKKRVAWTTCIWKVGNAMEFDYCFPTFYGIKQPRLIKPHLNVHYKIDAFSTSFPSNTLQCTDEFTNDVRLTSVLECTSSEYRVCDTVAGYTVLKI